MKHEPIHPHDRARRLLFEHPELIEDLLRRHVRAPWVDSLDLSTLERESAITLSDNLRERRSDAVWSVHFRPADPSAAGPIEVYLMILLEFQSTPDRFMPLRLLDYACRLWGTLRREKRLLSGRLLPPIFPVVLYNGRRAWHGPWSLGELLAPVPPALAVYQPEALCFPIDERHLPIDLDEGRDLVAAVAALDRGETTADIERIVERLVSWLRNDAQKPLRKAFAAWIQGVLSTTLSDEKSSEIRNVDDLLELKSMLHENVKQWPIQWKAEGLREGRKEGRKEGERDLLARLLERRFGPIDERTRARLDLADLASLQTWSTRLLDASTLDEIFASTDR